MTKEPTMETDKVAELLPCPVCGEQPKWRGSPTDYRAGIFRLQCIGETHLFQSYGATEEICITAWNTRLSAEARSAGRGGVGEDDAADKRETELMAELSGLDQMNIILIDLVRRAMRLIPEGKSLWWDEASAAVTLLDKAKALSQQPTATEETAP